jgi:hypothetical protein
MKMSSYKLELKLHALYVSNIYRQNAITYLTVPLLVFFLAGAGSVLPVFFTNLGDWARIHQRVV